MTALTTAPAVTSSPFALTEVIHSRRWLRRERPFPHVVGRDVFTPDFYGELDARFRRIERETPNRFQRNMTGYDASGAMLSRQDDGALGVFTTREWHDMIAGVAGVAATGDITASVHHHEPGSASGWVHADLNPGWFADPPAEPSEVRMPADGQVQYHRGTRPPGTSARETVRAVSVLFYLANPQWTPGDGGETGLFTHKTDRIAAQAVPPINNSLVAFECTPRSFHAFISNKRHPRNAVVMWLHREKGEVERRWGSDDIVYW